MTPQTPEALRTERVRALAMAEGAAQGKNTYRPPVGDFDCDCGVCAFCILGELPIPVESLARAYADLCGQHAALLERLEGLAEEWANAPEEPYSKRELSIELRALLPTPPQPEQEVEQL